MEEKKLTETEAEQVAGGEILLYNEGTRRTWRFICPKCQSRNLEFPFDKLDHNYNMIREGYLELSARDYLRFIDEDDYRYEMICRDCGYRGYANSFKGEYVRRPV